MSAPYYEDDTYALRRRLALTRCQLVHNLGSGYTAGCCVCQTWADAFSPSGEAAWHTPPTSPFGNDFECCASGRCEVCTPGYDWGRDG